jgi:hypothetical protein
MSSLLRWTVRPAHPQPASCPGQRKFSFSNYLTDSGRYHEIYFYDESGAGFLANRRCLYSRAVLDPLSLFIYNATDEESNVSVKGTALRNFVVSSFQQKIRINIIVLYIYKGHGLYKNRQRAHSSNCYLE